MLILDHQQFFSRLEKGLQSGLQEGTLFLSLKRFDEHATNKKRTFSVSNQQPDNTEYPCLIRVKQGKKTKFSTLVQPNDTDEFMNKYAQILKLELNQLCLQPADPTLEPISISADTQPSTL